MLSSDSECSTKNPIDTVPHDVLLEIFVHCLPGDRLVTPQPNPRIAPMLLCHVCSYWRTVALATPRLWSHLSYCLTARDIQDDLASLKFREEEIEFMRWWKKTQGSIAPFLRLEIEMAEDNASVGVTVNLDGSSPKFEFVKIGEDGEGVPIARDGMAIIMDYVTSAQHLEVDAVFWGQVLDVSDYGDYPNLRTLVTHYGTHPMDHYVHHTFSALRRLAILDDRVSLIDTIIPSQWSTLTHLSIATHHISLAFWIPLTLSVPHLQWAYIAFLCLRDADEYSNPIERVLPQLATLFIKRTNYDNFYLISPLFEGLHLPALTNLFLATTIQTWWNHDGMADIYNVLRSTPAIKNLTLRKSTDRLSSNEMKYAKGAVTATGSIMPIWSMAPGLVHLQLELDISFYWRGNIEQVLDDFACNGFLSSDNRWLDLDNPSCPIQMITVIDSGSRDARNFYKTSNIRKCATKASNIPLRVICKPVTDFGEAWMEWRSGN